MFKAKTVNKVNRGGDEGLLFKAQAVKKVDAERAERDRAKA
jgi:hypothetical protein